MTDVAGGILVTGADGALGRRLVSSLSQRGEQVVSVGRRKVPVEPSAHRVTADITDIEALGHALKRFAPRVVIHLAAMTGAACTESPDAAMLTNVIATRQLARASADAGVARFVFASSAAVYGDAYSVPVSETEALRGDSVYALTKIEAEAQLRAVSGHSRMEVVALRIFNIYGPTFQSSLVTRLLESSPESPVVVRGLDGFVRDYIHVDDVVRACDSAVSAHLPAAMTVVNVGSGEATSNARLLAVLSTRHKPAYVVEPGSPSYSVANVTRMREVLSFVGSPIAESI